MEYITSTRKKEEGCVFCALLEDHPEQDRQNYLVYRGQSAFVVMNLYPYNPGHLMILPRAHVAALSQVSFEAQVEIITLTSYFTELLSKVMQPDGYNVGLNLGRAAGAGITDHLHLHLVPRWQGDSNFMPVVGQTRVLPEELGDTYDKIVALLKEDPPPIPS